MDETNARPGASLGAGDWRPIEEAQTVEFLLLPEFFMLAFTSAVEPLRSANRLSGWSLYTWRLVSRDGGTVAS